MQTCYFSFTKSAKAKNIVEDATIKQTTVVKNRSKKKTKDRITQVGDNDN
jgi:CO dehydrogenase nickel-insertion accessory protein CooC1